MSISRAELDAMDRDELIEEIVDLSETVEELEIRMDAMSRWKQNTSEKLYQLEEENERLRAENRQLKERLDEIEATAEQAMTVASRGHDPDGRSKTEIAKHITRNTLVARAANGGVAKDRKLTISDVQEKAEPEHDLAWAIVDRAWSQLQEEWRQFHETSKDGQKAMGVKQNHITKPLARAVETDLGRTGLAKQFVGDEAGGGA